VYALFPYREKVLECIDKARKYLISPKVSFDVIGVNVSGDVSKRFDIEAEDIIMNCLKNFLGGFVMIGEERGVRVVGEPEWIIVVDPVDGSTNFTYDIPWSSISVAIAPYTKDAKVKDIVFAVVSEITRDRVYIFDISSIDVVNFKRKSPPAPIALGYFESPEAYKPLINYIMMSSRRLTIRSLGSAALDIVYVGLGNAEVFIDARAKLRNVDVAAALRIAIALGAKAIDCSNSFKDATEISINSVEKVRCIAVAYNDEVLEKLRNTLNQR
jgi:myo-inositol-1(or 4)-monophosphatase